MIYKKDLQDRIERLERIERYETMHVYGKNHEALKERFNMLLDYLNLEIVDEKKTIKKKK